MTRTIVQGHHASQTAVAFPSDQPPEIMVSLVDSASITMACLRAESFSQRTEIPDLWAPPITACLGFFFFFPFCDVKRMWLVLALLLNPCRWVSSRLSPLGSCHMHGHRCDKMILHSHTRFRVTHSRGCGARSKLDRFRFGSLVRYHLAHKLHQPGTLWAMNVARF